MDEYRGVEYLRRKLKQKRGRVLTRYAYYEMKNVVRDLNISTPESLRWLNEVLGWCATATDRLADRIVFNEFRNDNFGMNEIFSLNNPDIMADNAILSALIASCSFIYIYPDAEGNPKIQVIDGANATGIIDQATNLLKEGYAVLKRDEDTDQVLSEAYFLPYQTWYRENGQTWCVDHPAPYPLLVPVIFRPDSKRPFGHSRISRACMSLQNNAVRTIKRSEVTAEFYSFPQKWASGTDPEASMDRWKAAVSTMLRFDRDADGNSPTIGQFTQQSVTPHIEQLKMAASAFAGETGLTLEDLGFPQSNPSSSDAIKATHDNLRLTARKAQRTFGTGLLNAGYLAACVRDDMSYNRDVIYETKTAWLPIFEPDASSLSGVGDAIIKIGQAVPGYLTEDKLKDLLGV